MKEKRILLERALIILSVVIGVIIGVIDGNGPMLSAFSGFFIGGIVYLAIILLRIRSTKEDLYTVQDEGRRTNRKKDAVLFSQPRTRQTVQDSFPTPPKTR